jgi:hypothetical protein
VRREAVAGGRRAHRGEAAGVGPVRLGCRRVQLMGTPRRGIWWAGVPGRQWLAGMPEQGGEWRSER